MSKRCKTCDMNCSDECYRDDCDNYKQERVLQWLGIAVMCWIVIALVVLL